MSLTAGCACGVWIDGPWEVSCLYSVMSRRNAVALLAFISVGFKRDLRRRGGEAEWKKGSKRDERRDEQRGQCVLLVGCGYGAPACHARQTPASSWSPVHEAPARLFRPPPSPCTSSPHGLGWSRGALFLLSSSTCSCVRLQRLTALQIETSADPISKLSAHAKAGAPTRENTDRNTLTEPST